MKSATKTLKYSEQISQMTLEEKASLMSGDNFWNTKSISRLNIPSMMLTDGPHGLRKQGGKADHLGLNKSMPATCFPTAATLANSWDTSLLAEVGFYLGSEAAAEDVSVLLGPGLNIKRNPLCGRNFEYFSEDPYLTGKLAASMIRGIQSKGISACPKHFAVNSQEKRRMAIDELVDKRALHEIYLEGFRYAIKEGKAKTIMTSYNRLNGTYTNENHYLLQDVLFKQWNYDGLVVTDWGGSNDRVKGLIAGNQLEMPSTGCATDQEIIAAVKDGSLEESILDERVNSLLRIIMDTKPALGKGRSFQFDDHHQKAIDAARRSIVLLKNKDHILPLQEDVRIGVIGDFAETSRYQGAGSSLINPTRIDHALDKLQKSNLNICGYEKGFKRLGGANESLKRKAVALAAKSDVVLLFLGLDEGSEAEGVDRSHMKLPKNQLHLFRAVASVNPNIVVILSGGSPVELPFSKQAKAIVHGYLGGQGGGSAIVDVLTGKYNPSGKLAESYPMYYKDVSCAAFYPGNEMTSEHRESIYIGYRYLDIAKKKVRFPFGYGLSYTSFAYRSLKAERNQVSFILENTGNVFGEEVAQVYIKPLNSKVFRPKKELKGFAKVGLQKGESQEVTIALDEHAFAYYNVEKNDWMTEPGTYEICVGSSSRHLLLSAVITVKETEVTSPYSKEAFPHYYAADIANISDKEFSALLGYRLPPAQWDKSKPLGYNDTIEQGKYKSLFGRLLYYLILFIHKILKCTGKPIAANNVLFALHLPFRGISRLSGGKVSMGMVDALLAMVNGHFLKGLPKFLKAWLFKK